MSLRASHLGELAARLLSKKREGVVTRVFRTSAYLRSGDDFVLVLRGDLRSPITIDLQDGEVGRLFRVGEAWSFSPTALRSGRLEVSLAGTELYRSALRRKSAAVLPSGKDLAKGVAMLSSLYDVSKSGPSLKEDRALREFVEGTLLPMAEGDEDAPYGSERFLPLFGRGGGFTPAGDDFISGFAATFNFVARSRGSRRVSIPKRLIMPRTVPESAATVAYAVLGYVDEGLERLVLASLGERDFRNELLEVVQRGHTSGIDMSLGVLLCEAALAEVGEKGSLDRCLDALWYRHGRTLIPS